MMGDSNSKARMLLTITLALVCMLSFSGNRNLWADSPDRNGEVAGLQDIPKEVKFTEEGTARISAKLPDGSPVEAIVRTTEYSENRFPYVSNRSYDQWGGWGGDNHPIFRIVTEVQVMVRDTRVPLRLSAFGDLANPHTMGFQLTDGGFRLSISGAEAGAFYTAELDFKGRCLAQRRVMYGEFPDEIVEKTEYRINEEWC